MDYSVVLYVAEVAPLVGAWIEIKSTIDEHVPTMVAPLVGAWIEISPSLADIAAVTGSLLL